MASLQQLFMPEGQKFYKLFDEVAANLHEVSIEFHAAIHNHNERAAHLAKLDELEKQNDNTTHRLFVELGRNFITPFDREDIHYLTSGLDDIIDLSFGVVRQLNSYGITDPGNTTQYVAIEFKRLNDLLVQTLNGLKNKRALSSLAMQCMDMKKIIVTCDARVDSAIAGLFPMESNPVEIIKWMEHYELLQALIGKYENAVNVLETIIIKYS
jgi:uncharacterized protein Yka (UPF0111/DUF47 family)